MTTKKNLQTSGMAQQSSVAPAPGMRNHTGESDENCIPTGSDGEESDHDDRAHNMRVKLRQWSVDDGIIR